MNKLIWCNICGKPKDRSEADMFDRVFGRDICVSCQEKILLKLRETVRE